MIQVKILLLSVLLGLSSLYATNDVSGLTLTTIDGDLIKLDDGQFKVTAVVFWATWCTPCLYEIPTLMELHKEYGDKGLRIIGVSVDDEKTSVTHFLEQTTINYPIVFRAGTSNTAFTQAFDPIQSIPTIYLFDQSGKIITKHMGFTSEHKLKKIILPSIGIEYMPQKKRWWNSLFKLNG